MIPLSKKYYASVHQDLGIQAAHLEYGEVEQTNNSTGTWGFGTQRVVTDTQIDNGKSIDCGYIPFTVLQIISKSFGPNSNTETPIIVNSSNEEVPLKNWQNNLTGSNFTNVSGDHIIPKIDNPSLFYVSTSSNAGVLSYVDINSDNVCWHFLAPATKDTGTVTSVSERKSVYFWDDVYAQFETHQGANAGRRPRRSSCTETL